MKKAAGKIILLIALSFTQNCFANTSQNTVKVQTSLPYIMELAKEVSCDSKSFDIQSIIDLGVDPHTFHMTPKNRIDLAKSDAVIYIGADLEAWLIKIRKNKNDTKNQVWLELSNGMNLKKLNDENESTHSHSHSDGEAHHHEHNHLEYDPHIWQSPELTKVALNKIAATFISLKPNEKSAIEKCTQNFMLRIDQAVLTLKKDIQNLPADKRVIATNHDALGYFADAFGFKILSITGLSDEAAPTPEELKKIIVKIKNQNVKAIFLESTGNMRNIKTVAHETGVEIGGELYTDSLGAKGSNADTVISMWQTNVKTILNALKS
ncbi:metal ABC transporter substrate-binding protein [Fluviispira vulneris]|uniref:metal ABC transporter substrate-binding protein n=1 Tax=Fluviispira vulneris TaxID=2763012 RepID=UPI00164420D7|nr:metal ABC transporter substrate-binding protein [Fluviispira vulneris]